MRRVEEEIASSSSGTGRIEKESKWYKMTWVNNSTKIKAVNDIYKDLNRFIESYIMLATWYKTFKKFRVITIGKRFLSFGQKSKKGICNQEKLLIHIVS
jgi:hypothetical protein